MIVAPPEKVDAVVVGCGPAGGIIAGRLAKDGYKVIVLEKRPQVGVPVRCGEATGGRHEIKNFLPVDENFIVAEINSARMYAPNLEYAEKLWPGVGVVLKRDKFDQAIATQAQEHGADIRTHHEVTALRQENGWTRGVSVTNRASGKSYDIQARVTIGADGIEGFVGRWSGLTGHLLSKNVHGALEYLVEGDGLPTDWIELRMTKRYAPGGYVWVFPKGPGKGAIGLGIHPVISKGAKPQALLDEFIRDFFPHVKVGRMIGGAVSGSKVLKTMVDNGLLLTGDAGRHTNPLSGGGIMNALEGSEEAHKVLTRALAEDDLGRNRLQEYDRAWWKRNGSLINKYFFLRQLFFKFDENDMNRVIEVIDTGVKAQDGDITNWPEFMWAAFRNAPSLLWKASSVVLGRDAFANLS